MEDDDPWHLEHDLARVPGFEFYVPQKGRELRLRWHLELAEEYTYSNSCRSIDGKSTGT